MAQKPPVLVVNVTALLAVDSITYPLVIWIVHLRFAKEGNFARHLPFKTEGTYKATSPALL